MSQYLSDTSVPHKTQHALVQLSDRMARGAGMARRWYPKIIALAQNKEPQLRSMAAWVMGQDNHSEEFHQTLHRLVDDPAPPVRWNAALARFGDAIAVIGPGEAQVFEALRALVLIGQPETLADVERFAAGVPGMSERVRQQALGEEGL